MGKQRAPRAGEDKLGNAAILGLVAMALGVFILANDFTALTVALPRIEKDFGVDVTTVQWVITGYALAFGVLIVTGGKLADMFGRRLVFFIGSSIFASFSFLGGFSTDVWMLIASRILMGLGGAMMWPAILGMTYSLLPSHKAGLAGGIIIGAVGFGNAVGPLLGGALTELVSWRWVFYINLPITAFSVLVTWWVIPKVKNPKGARKIDYIGVALLSAGLLALLLGLDDGTDLGWLDWWIIGLFAFAGLALTGFGFVERAVGARALLPREVMLNREFLAACVATLLMSALKFSALLYLPQFMLKRLGFTVIEAGAGLLPMLGLFALTSFLSGPLHFRLGPKIVAGAGAGALAAGMFLLSGITQTSPYTALIPGMAVFGIGMGLFYSSLTTAAITAQIKSRASLAGAVMYMFQIAGGAIGIGFNTAIIVTAPSLAEGISRAFFLDGCLAVASLLVVLFFVGGKFNKAQLVGMMHHHRAH